MAIERLSFPHYLNIQAGIQINPDNQQAQFGRVLRRFGGSARRLPEGEYDLTPPIWTSHNSNVYRHTLTVLDSGIGVVRMIPKYGDSHSGVLDHEGIYDFKAGGRQVRLPDDEAVAVVLGPNRLNQNVCLYELVYYIPGPNPLKEKQSNARSNYY